jgi:hypothetical protein
MLWLIPCISALRSTVGTSFGTLSLRIKLLADLNIVTYNATVTALEKECNGGLLGFVRRDEDEKSSITVVSATAGAFQLVTGIAIPTMVSYLD